MGPRGLALLHRLDGSRTLTDPTYNPRSRTPRRRSGSRPFQSETLSSLPSFRPVCGSQLRVEDSLSIVKPFGQTLFFCSHWVRDMNTSFAEIAEESRTPSVGSVGVDQRVQTPGSSPGADGSALPGCLGNAAGVDVSSNVSVEPISTHCLQSVSSSCSQDSFSGLIQRYRQLPQRKRGSSDGLGEDLALGSFTRTRPVVVSILEAARKQCCCWASCVSGE